MTTQTVIVESNSIVTNTVTTTDNVIQTTSVPTVIVGGIIGPPGPPGLNSSVSASTDVDVTNRQDGSALIWNNSSSKWQATTLLEKQIINAGFF